MPRRKPTPIDSVPADQGFLGWAANLFGGPPVDAEELERHLASDPDGLEPDWNGKGDNCPDCHGTLPDGAPTTVADREFMVNLGLDMTLGMTGLGGIGLEGIRALQDPTAMSIGGVLLGVIPGPNVGKLAGRTGNALPNLSPDGAGRSGAFREAKRNAGIPVSRPPDRELPNLDRRGNVQPGRTFEWDVRGSNGQVEPVQIRDDAGGHDYGAGSEQNRGPHFNDPDVNHYDY